jgi:hypothetical protein
MKIYEGRRMCDLFTLNFIAPSYSIVKRKNKKTIRFILGEHTALFEGVAKIYSVAKEAHQITGPISVILAEDETKVISRVLWESRSDSLVGFCGPKEGHVCSSTFKPVVGTRQMGYENIVDAFQNYIIGSFARVIMVNPLHEKLPRLVLVVSYTCNCFDASWMKKQWTDIDKLWRKHCEQSVGPIIGHTSNGDSKRRQLMLADFTSTSGNRFRIEWEGWQLSAKLHEGNRVTGLHDQDFIHNGKKLVNPLDSPVKTMQLGEDVCCLEHIGHVYNKFTFNQHGLRLEDVKRTDRQNWAST